MSNALFPVINKYFIDFFQNNSNENSVDDSDNLSLELFNQIILELNEHEANIMLNQIHMHYDQIPNESKSSFINSILLLLHNTKRKQRKDFTFMIGCLYLIARHINSIILSDVEIQLIYFIINKQSDYVSDILFNIVLNYVKHSVFDESDILTVQCKLTDKFNINNNATYLEIKHTIYDKLLSLHGDISTSDEYVDGNNNKNNNTSVQYEQFPRSTWQNIYFPISKIQMNQ